MNELKSSRAKGKKTNTNEYTVYESILKSDRKINGSRCQEGGGNGLEEIVGADTTLPHDWGCGYTLHVCISTAH